MSPEESIIQIVQKAEEQKLPYLMVGGHAMILYGVTRFTRDVDLLIPDTHEKSWIEFLSQNFGYRLYHSTHAFLQFENDSSNFPAVDVMLVDLKTWEKLNAKSQIKPLDFGAIAHLPHPTHLIALKLTAVSSPYRRKGNVDWSDIINLIHEQKLSLDDPEFRAIVLRYGSEEILIKLQKDLS